MGKLEEYKESSQQNRKAIPEILGLTIVCWVLKGFEWYFLSLALGLTLGLPPALLWLALFLIHPLVTALAFCAYYGVGQEGNFEGRSSTLNVLSPLEKVAQLYSMAPQALEKLLEKLKIS
jgi:hypothetical protein